MLRPFDSRLRWLIVGLLFGVFLTAFLPREFLRDRMSRTFVHISKEENRNQRAFGEFSSWTPFLSDPSFDSSSWKKNCWIDQPTFPFDEKLITAKKNLSAHAVCREMFDLIRSIYKFDQKTSKAFYPTGLAQKIRKMFNDDPDLISQTIDQKLFFAMNKYTFENTVYNPIRGRRPTQPPEVPIEKYLNETIELSRRNCDLCNYQNFTATDVLGRMENEKAYSAANAFKFEEWHSMFMPRQHDIRKLSLEDLKDVFTLAWKWIRSVHKKSGEHRFASILWDNLPHGGASQVHPHLHATVRTDHYFGQFESIRAGAEQYFRDFQSNKIHREKNYFRAIQNIHLALNLAVSLNGLTLLVPITSHKEFDLILLAENFDERVIEVIYKILQGYFKKLGQFSFSSSLYFPVLSSHIDDRGVTPVFFRIIPRGQASSLLSEVSSLDLLSIYNVNKLPSDIFKEVQTWL